MGGFLVVLNLGKQPRESEGGVSASALARSFGSEATALVDGAATGRAAKSSTGVIPLPERGATT